jgi:hypothetical protein
MSLKPSTEGGAAALPFVPAPALAKLKSVKAGVAQFLAEVVGGGRHALAVLSPSGGMSQEWCPDLARLTQRAMRRAQARGVYFTPGAFDRDDRHAKYAAQFYVLWIDADPNQQMADQAACLKAAVSFCKAVGLLPSYIVDSGRGVHLYFLLHPTQAAEWVELSATLKAVWQALGYEFDPAVHDAARVMRLPGTINQKTGRECVAYRVGDVRYTAEEVRALLVPHLPVNEAPALASASSDGSGALASDFARIVAPGGCAALAAEAAVGGRSYPGWLAVLSVAKHCTGGEALAHEISARHADYDEAGTGRKLHSLTGGPATCDHISGFAPECRECPHRG